MEEKPGSELEERPRELDSAGKTLKGSDAGPGDAREAQPESHSPGSAWPAAKEAADVSPACPKARESEPPAKEPCTPPTGAAVTATPSLAPATFTLKSVCFSASQAPAVQSMALSFQPGAVLAPSQPLVYLPPPSCVAALPSPLTVPPTLALPVLPPFPQDHRLPSLLAPSELRSYPYAFSVARPLAADPKAAAAEAGPLSSPPPSTEGSPPVAAGASPPASGADLLPSTPAAAASCGSTALPPGPGVLSRAPGALASLSPLKSPPQLERETVSSPECSEMPLDLSSKSNRQKLPPPSQRKTPPMPVLTPVHTSSRALLTTVLSKAQRVAQAMGPPGAAAPAASPFVIFPELLRNGEQSSWVKSSTALLSTIPGTYVGVANPVPASVLLGKDSGRGCSRDARHLPKQESISIIDQGEPRGAGKKAGAEGQGEPARPLAHGHAPPAAPLRPSKEPSLWSPGQGNLYSRCSVNGKPAGTQLLPPPGWPPYPQAPLLPIGISAAGQRPPSQASPSKRTGAGEVAAFPKAQPAESAPAAPTGPDVPSQGKGCKPAWPSLASPSCVSPALQAAPPDAKGLAANHSADRLEADSAAESAPPPEAPPDGCGPPQRPGDGKPRNRVLTAYLSRDLQAASASLAPPPEAKHKERRCAAARTSDVPPYPVHQVDLSRVKTERVEPEEPFAPSAGPDASGDPPKAQLKSVAHVKVEGGLPCKAKRQHEGPDRPAHKRLKCRGGVESVASCKSGSQSQHARKVSGRAQHRVTSRWPRGCCPGRGVRHEGASAVPSRLPVGDLSRPRRGGDPH